MPSIYEAYAIYAEQTINGLGTEEMKVGMPNRIFNVVESYYGDPDPEKALINRLENYNGERIRLKRGTYRVNGLSFLTMLSAGVPPVPPVPTQFLDDVYPGYCILFDANNPPLGLDDMKGVLCVGTMGTAYDGVPSIFDCVLNVENEFLDISLGHQCSYNQHGPGYDPRPRVYLRIGGSDFHVCARIAIFKIA
jgi:hypothetical protein